MSITLKLLKKIFENRVILWIYSSSYYNYYESPNLSYISDQCITDYVSIFDLFYKFLLHRDDNFNNHINPNCTQIQHLAYFNYDNITRKDGSIIGSKLDIKWLNYFKNELLFMCDKIHGKKYIRKALYDITPLPTELINKIMLY